MKVLIACDDYCYRLNGRFYLRSFGMTLAKRYLMGFDEVCLAFRAKTVDCESELGPYELPVDDDRIHVCPIPFFQGPKEYAAVWKSVRKTLRETVSSCQAAVLRIPSTTAFAALRQIRKSGLPYGVEVVANPAELMRDAQSLTARMLWYVMHHRQQRACAEADCVSYVTRSSLQKIYPGRRPDRFESYYSSVELDPRFFTGARRHPVEPFVICHVSSAIHNCSKGHRTLLEVAQKLYLQGLDFRVRIAGTGRMIPSFETYARELGIADKVAFEGYLQTDQLFELLSESDMMIFPTASEGLPRVVIEAMATGLPCLSTTVGGIPELLRKDCLFAPGDVEGFAGKAAQLMNDASLYEEISRINYISSMEYAPDLLNRRRAELYRALRQKAASQY